MTDKFELILRNGNAELKKEIPLGVYGELVKIHFPDFFKLMGEGQEPDAHVARPADISIMRSLRCRRC